MNPIYISNDVSDFIKQYTEMFGFSVKHVLKSFSSTITVLENAEGIRIDAMQRKTYKSYMAVRINMDDLEEALKEYYNKGFMLVSAEETASSKSALIARENDVELLLVQHKK